MSRVSGRAWQARAAGRMAMFLVLAVAVLVYVPSSQLQGTGPAITSLSAAVAPVNGGSFTLGIDGQNFLSTSQVQFGGTALATTYVSSKQLSAVVPSSLLTSLGTIPITVLNPASPSSASGVTVNVTSSIPVGAYQVTIGYDKNVVSLEPGSVTGGTGAGFTSVPFTVNINNTSGTVTIKHFQTSYSPTGTFSVAQLRFKGAGNGATNLTLSINSLTDVIGNELPRPPAVVSLNPAVLTYGTSAAVSNALDLKIVQRGDINGNGSVTIGDALVTALTVGGLMTPPLLNSVGDLNLNGFTNIGDALVLARFSGKLNPNLPTPSIESVSPNPAVAGGSLTITAAGLGPNTTDHLVLFPTTGGGVTRVSPTGITPQSDTQPASVTVTLPANAVSGAIQIFRTDAPMGSPEYALSIAGSVTPLTLTTVSPFYDVTPGSTVTLSGSAFDPTPSGNSVLFQSAIGTTAGTVTAATLTSLTVVVPPDAVCGDVTVTTGGKTSDARSILISGTSCPLRIADILGGGVPGDTLVIEGSGFDFVTPSNNVVTFAASGGGTAIAAVMQAGQTQLHVKIPATAVAGNVRVTVAGQTSNAFPFPPPGQPLSTPTLDAITPALGFLGKTLVVALTGTDFIPGASTVSVDPPNDITVSLGAITSTSINATFTISPGATTGARNVTVSTAGGGTSNAVTFTLYGAPTLNSISPSSGQPSSNPTITLTGSQFVAGATAITVAGSGETITTGAVNVTNPNTLTLPFTVTPATSAGIYWRFEEGTANTTPSGSGSILDSSGSGNHATASGTPVYRSDVPVTLIPKTGATNTLSLEFDSADDKVSFGSAFPFNVLTSATVEFWLKVNSLQHSAVLWGRPDSSDTNGFHFYVNPDRTVGFSYSTPSGELHVIFGSGLSSGGVPVTLSNWNHIAITKYGNDYALYINGALAATNTDLSPDLPTSVGWSLSGREGYPLLGNVDEVRISDTVLRPDQFLLNGPQISPNYGFAGIIANVTVTGPNFVPGSTTVAVSPPDDITVNIGTVTTTSIAATFTIGAGAAPGPRTVTVSTPGGTSSTTFTVYGKPTLFNISPSSGEPSTNPTITLAGSQFVAGATVVTVAGSGAPVTTGTVNVTSPGSLTVPFTIPAAASGDYGVSVTTGAGTSNALTFTVTVLTPFLSSISPLGATAGQSNVPVTLAGGNLAGTTDIQFFSGFLGSSNDTAITVSNIQVNAGGTQLTATANIGAGAVPGFHSVHVTRNGQAFNAGGDFEVYPPGNLALYTFSPSQGDLGQTVHVTITGASLGDITNIRLDINGQADPGISVSGVTASDSSIAADLALTGTVTLGPHQVVLIGLNGSTTFTNAYFTVRGPGALTVSSLGPNFLTQGAANVPFTVSGSNMTAVTGLELVKPDNSAETQITVANFQANASSLSANLSIGANAPIGPREIVLDFAGGPKAVVQQPVYVQTSSGLSVTSASSDFGYGSILAGRAGQRKSPFNIYGNNLTGITGFKFQRNGVDDNSITVSEFQNSSYSLTATVNIASNAPTGLRTIVLMQGATDIPTTLLLSVRLGDPFLTSISPLGATVGQGNVPVTLAGGNLAETTDIQLFSVGFLGSSNDRAITFSNLQVNAGGTQLTATANIGAGAVPGSHSVNVIRNRQGFNAGGDFRVYATGDPALYTFSPSQGDLGQTVHVTITGASLGNITAIRLDTNGQADPGISVSGVTASDSSIAANLALTGTVTLGPHQVVLIGSNGSTTFTNAYFTVRGPGALTVSSLGPNFLTQGAANVPFTVSGSNMTAVTGLELVKPDNSAETQITVANFQANASSVSANLSIGANAPIGPRAVVLDFAGGKASPAQPVYIQSPGGLYVSSASYASYGIVVAGRTGQQSPFYIYGNNFTGITGFKFQRNGVDDNSITVSGFQNSSYSLTATVSIASTAPTGLRTIVLMQGATDIPTTLLLSVSLGDPFLTSISPLGATVGQGIVPITITGGNLAGTTDIQLFSGFFGSSNDTAITFSNIQVNADGTQLTTTANIGAGAVPGFHSVHVTRNGQAFNAGGDFEVYPVGAPALFTFTPAQGDRGHTVDVTMTGASLANITGLGFFNADVDVGITVQSLTASANSITASLVITSTAMIGPHFVFLMGNNGSITATNAIFNVRTSDGTSVSGLSPSLLSQGANNVPFTVPGTNMSAVSGIGFITTDGTPETGITTAGFQASALSASTNVSLTSEVPIGPRRVVLELSSGAKATVAQPVYVQTPGGMVVYSASLGSSFGAIVSGNPGQQTHLNVNGNNLGSVSDLQFQMNGVDDNSIIVSGFRPNVEHLSGTVTIAGNAPLGTRRIVLVQEGTEIPTSLLVTIVPNSPTLTFISPASAGQGQSVNVALAGSNFVLGATTVTVSGTGVTAQSVTVLNSTAMTATFVIAANASIGPRSVTVTTAGGTSGAITFTVNSSAGSGPPTLTSIAPSSAAQGQQANVALGGTNFVSGETTITVAGTGVTVQSIDLASSNLLTATFVIEADAATGGRGITVANAFGTSNPLTFTVNAAPAPDGYIVSTVVGQSLITEGGDAIQQPLSPLTDVALDAQGNLFVASPNRNKVYKVTPAGVITTLAGTGQAGSAGDGGPATAAQLNLPRAVVVDASANLYIADANTNRIRKVGPNGIITTVAGTGASGSSGDGGAATAAQLSSPSGLGIDASGNIYINDLNNRRIRKIGPGGLITTVAGNGTAGFSGDNGPATSAQINTDGSTTKLAIDASGNLFIPDAANHRLRKVTADGIISTVAGTGTAGFTGDGGLATSARLSSPRAAAIDAFGSIILSDSGNNRIRYIQPNGTIATAVGNGSFGFNGDGNNLLTRQLSAPLGLALDSTGTLVYIADQSSSRVRLVAGGVIRTVAGNAGVFSGDNIAATSSRLYSPRAIAFTPEGELLVANSRLFRIQKVASDGTISTIAGTGDSGSSGDNGPAISATIGFVNDLAADTDGSIYLSTSDNRVRKIAPDGRISLFAGTGTAGFSGDNGQATSAQLNNPNGIAFDGSGNTYVADSANHVVRKIDADGKISTIAGTGVAGLSGDDGPATAAQLNTPRKLAFVAGYLYVADSDNTRIRRIAPDGTISTFSTFGGRAVAKDAAGNVFISSGTKISRVAPGGISTTLGGISFGFSGDEGPALMASFNAQSLTINSSGDIFFGDDQDNVVRKMTRVPPGSGVLSVLPAGFNIHLGPTTVVRSTLTITFSGSGLPWTASAHVISPTGGNWLSLGQSAGTGSTSTYITIDPAGLPLGSFNGSVTIASQAVNGPLTIPVTITLVPPHPSLFSVTPSSGNAGSSVNVLLSGTNFITGRTAVAVTGSGVTANSINVLSDTTLSASLSIATSAPAGTRGLYVATAGGASATQSFVVINPPSLTALTPNSALQGQSVNVQFDGANFVPGATAIVIGGTAGITAGPLTVLNGTLSTATLTIAAGAAPGPRSISISTPNGASGSLPFTVFSSAQTNTFGYSVSTIAGLTTIVEGGPATGQPLPPIQDVALDASGNLYIAAFNRHKVYKIAPNGALTTFAGTGIPGPAGDGGLATAAQLNGPRSVSLDASGNLYIADSGNHRIRKVTADGTITTAAGNGSATFSGDGGSPLAASLFSPSGVLVDASNNLFIIDRSNQRVRKVDPFGRISTVAGTGSAGFSGDGGAATAAELSLDTSTVRLSLDASGNLYIPDTLNHRIRKVGTDGTITTVAGTGSAGFSGDSGPATAAQLSSPRGASLDASGNIYISDSGNNRIRKIAGGTITTFAGAGNFGFNGDGLAATSTLFASPFGLIFDSAGNLYVADQSNNRVRLISSGIVTTVAGQGPGFGGDNGPPLNARFYSPSGVVVDAAGNLFIADTRNARIRKLTPTGALTTVAGNGSTSTSGTAGPALTTAIGAVNDIALDANTGAIFLVSTDNRVRKFADGTITVVAGSGTSGLLDGPAAQAQIANPQGVAVASNGDLYLSDSNNRIRKVSNGTVTTIAGNGSTQGDDGAAIDAQLAGPRKIAVESSTGNIYFTERTSGRLRKIDVASGIITSVLTSDAGWGLGFDFSGDLYSSGYSLISKTPPGGMTTKIASPGGNTASRQGFTGDNGAAKMVALAAAGLAVTPAGEVYFADNQDQLIRKLTPVPEGIAALSVTSLGFFVRSSAQTTRNLAIALDGIGSFTWTASVSGANWLSANPLNGTGSSSTTLTVNPAGVAPGEYNASVTISSPQAVNGSVIVPVTLVVPPQPPTLTEVNPSNGKLGTVANLQLTGANFVNGATAVVTTGTGITTTSVNVVNETLLNASITIDSDAVPGVRGIYVVTSGGSSTTQTFTVNAAGPAEPTLQSITPDSGSPGQIVDVLLTGSNFVSGTTIVTIAGAGVAANSVVVQSGTSLTASFVIASDASAGPRGVIVSTAAGTSGSLNFTVNLLAPTLQSLLPDSGIQGETVNVTLTGSNFVAGATTVSIAGTGVVINDVVVQSRTSVAASFVITPDATPGARGVIVSTAAGTSNSVTFTVNPGFVPSGSTTTLLSNGKVLTAGGFGFGPPPPSAELY